MEVTYFFIMLVALLIVYGFVNATPYLKARPFLMFMLGIIISSFASFNDYFFKSVSSLEALKNIFGDLSYSSGMNKIVFMVIGGAFVAAALLNKMNADFRRKLEYDEDYIRHNMTLLKKLEEEGGKESVKDIIELKRKIKFMEDQLEKYKLFL